MYARSPSPDDAVPRWRCGGMSALRPNGRCASLLYHLVSSPIILYHLALPALKPCRDHVWREVYQRCRLAGGSREARATALPTALLVDTSDCEVYSTTDQEVFRTR